MKKDPKVGLLRDDERTVYQCRKTGLLYVWEQPPKRYVSVQSVELKDQDDDDDRSKR